MLIVRTVFRLGARFKRVLAIGILGLVGILLCASSAGATTSVEQANILKVSNVHIGGFMDPHNQALINSTLDRASDNGVSLYVIQLDSDGVAGANISKLAKELSEADFVVAVWVGPTSAKYSNELDELVDSADFVGGANKKLANKAGAKIVAPSLREFYAQLDQKQVDRLSYVLDMGCSKSEVEQKTDQCEDVKLAKDENFKLNIAPQFEKLSPISNLGHSLIKPGFAIGILVMGLSLLAFEFFAASVGVAAVAGVLASLSGVYGLGYLPTQWWAVGLVAFGVFALVVDVQAGGVGIYTGLGTILIFGGSYFAVDRVGSYGVTLVSAIVITVMALLFTIGAIPSLIRTRFGTPTIGREDFIGEEGIADGDIDPEGSVKLRGGSWKARTNHATPIKNGDKCRIVKIEGIILEVEPLVGAARDHREGRKSRS